MKCETTDLTTGLSRNYTNDGVHSIALFTCGLGYTLIGTSTFLCNENGIWNNNNLPECGTCQLPGTEAYHAGFRKECLHAKFNCPSIFLEISFFSESTRSILSNSPKALICLECFQMFRSIVKDGHKFR